MIFQVKSSLMDYEADTEFDRGGESIVFTRVRLSDRWDDPVAIDLHFENVRCGRTYDPFLEDSSRVKADYMGNWRIGLYRVRSFSALLDGVEYENCTLSGFWVPGEHWDCTPKGVSECLSRDRVVASFMVLTGDLVG
jgi:hypothetical protein